MCLSHYVWGGWGGGCSVSGGAEGWDKGVYTLFLAIRIIEVNGRLRTDLK